MQLPPKKKLHKMWLFIRPRASHIYSSIPSSANPFMTQMDTTSYHELMQDAYHMCDAGLGEENRVATHMQIGGIFEEWDLARVILTSCKYMPIE